MTISHHTIVTFSLLTLLLTGQASAEPRSGYEFLKPETRSMQDDDFENPGLLAVEQGHELFNQKLQRDNKSCASCHGENGDKLDIKAIASYPIYNNDSKEIISLQQRIKLCRSRISDTPLTINHPDLLALETFVRHQAKGQAVNIKTSGPAAELLKKGKALYETRYGLIDISCYQCHTQYPGQMVRGQKISQGQSNGFPAYRLGTGEITNLNQRITQCLNLMKAEPFPSDSVEIKLLELYLMSRSNGLPIETPAVRY